VKREIVLLLCGILFLGAGALLLYLSQQPAQSEALSGAASAPVMPQEKRTREQLMGFFRVSEDLDTGVFEVFISPIHRIAQFKPPIELEIAGTWGISNGAFFAQVPKGPEGDPPRCQLFKTTDGLTSVRSFSWNGRCRVPQVMFSSIFWLDYAPFGTSVLVSLPLQLDEATMRFRLDWKDEASAGMFEVQKVSLSQRVSDSCGAPDISNSADLSQSCRAVLRALTLLTWSGLDGEVDNEDEAANGRAAIDRLVRDLGELPEAAADFVREVSEELRRELDEILSGG
jgi:hypothetical protein